ncbi:MAG: BrnA antitoxin family protein [Spirochaetaceae bacterium]|nr:BrnA antitoxin family protein [Spirochaetaceae bacterium]
MKGHDKPPTPDQIDAVEDENIDFSDIPELDEMFWKRAEIVEPDRTEQVTIRVKRSVLAYFKAPGKGYQTRMNQVLESYVRARRQTE